MFYNYLLMLTSISQKRPSPWGKRANMNFILFGIVRDKKKNGGLVLGELRAKLAPSKRRTILGRATGIFWPSGQ